MKPLEQIIQETYGHKKTFKENGQLANEDAEDMRMVETVMIDLVGLLGSHIIDSAKAIRALDELIDDNY